MPKGGKRKGAGRPPVPDAKKHLSIKLRPRQLDWLKSQSDPAAVLIERALDRVYDIPD